MNSNSGVSHQHRLILALTNESLGSLGCKTAFVPLGSEQLDNLLSNSGAWLGPRALLEQMPQFRQVIPYIALRVGDEFVRYTRTPAGGEMRLHGRISIGLGGHVDLSDIVIVGNSVDILRTANVAGDREVFEELGSLSCVRKEWVGLLIDNDTEVGRVHIGLVGIWTLSEAPVGLAEDAIGDVSLVRIDDLLEQHSDRIETWSAILARWLTS